MVCGQCSVASVIHTILGGIMVFKLNQRMGNFRLSDMHIVLLYYYCQ